MLRTHFFMTSLVTASVTGLAPMAAVACLADCGGEDARAGSDASSDGSRADAGVDAEAGYDASPPPIPPPSRDCRFIDDSTTCVDTYILPSSQLYTCGDIVVGDPYDAGIALPFPPPPLPTSVDCRNVAVPMVEAGPPSGQLGALWCCLQDPSQCVRALALDGLCASHPAASAAYSCPGTGANYPPGSGGGSSCVPVSAGDATLTPPLASNEMLTCCPEAVVLPSP